MIKKEMREKWITYCDYCKKEIDDYQSTSKHYKDGTIKHFHSMYTGEETCLEKYEKEELKSHFLTHIGIQEASVASEDVKLSYKGLKETKNSTKPCASEACTGAESTTDKALAEGEIPDGQRVVDQDSASVHSSRTDFKDCLRCDHPEWVNKEGLCMNCEEPMPQKGVSPLIEYLKDSNKRLLSCRTEPIPISVLEHYFKVLEFVLSKKFDSRVDATRKSGGGK